MVSDIQVTIRLTDNSCYLTLWATDGSGDVALDVSHLEYRKHGYFKSVLIYNCLLTKAIYHQLIFVVYA